MLTDITQWAIDIVYSFGYVGVFFLTALANMNLLIPTQLTLPLAGFLVGQGYFSLILVLAASTAGSLSASLALYLMGLWSGGSLRRVTKRIRRFDKLAFMLDLNKASKMFERHGREAILSGRFAPGIGAPISVLAGFERMPIWQFTFYTALGSALWNAGFIGLGWELGTQWPLVKQYASSVEYVLLVAVPAAIFWLLWRRRKARG
ncbi:MAG: DedA family protein [Actinomycetota bacterium]|nr:DedA family protein [Actinomycetota bacterium]